MKNSECWMPGGTISKQNVYLELKTKSSLPLEELPGKKTTAAKKRRVAKGRVDKRSGEKTSSSVVEEEEEEPGVTGVVTLVPNQNSCTADNERSSVIGVSNSGNNSFLF